MELRLDRTIPIPLAEQIKGQITYAISYGRLPMAHALPSVRELSANLGVSPATISQVYRELAQQGLVVSRPGAGTFVADLAQIDARAARHATQDSLQQLVDSFVRQAMLLGHDTEAIRSVFEQSLVQYRPNGHPQRVLMVGNFSQATSAYAREIGDLWHDLDVEMVPVLIDQLKVDLAGYHSLLTGIKLAITLPTRLQAVRALLEPRYSPVAAVAFTVSGETRRRLATIQPQQCVGIISTYPEFLQTIVDNVAGYGMLRTPPICAVLGQEEQIGTMLGEIDVLIYASGSESICERLPARVEAFEYRHSPESDSVNRLRPFLASSSTTGSNL